VRRILAVAGCLLASSCGKRDGASDAVVLFAGALADSSYSAAWQLLTPESQAWYDSTVVVLHHFGYTEAAGAVAALGGGDITEQEFAALTGEQLFSRMVSAAPETRALSTSIRSVVYRDSTLAVVVVRTGDGPQEIPVRRTAGAWRIDLTGLGPLPEEGD
jgi:hypothetical protein